VQRPSKASTATAPSTPTDAASVPSVASLTADERWQLANKIAESLPSRKATAFKANAPPSKALQELNRKCAELGIEAGLTRWVRSYTGTDTTITAVIVVGKAYEIAVDGDSLDACYLTLLRQLVEEHG
jgi:hypothetical protein